MDIKEALEQLSIEEKAALLAGTEFMKTNSVPRLDIPQLIFADGPHGLRKANDNHDPDAPQSEPATSFPTASAMACGWNEDNPRAVGEAVGLEALHYGVNVLLGPGVNIKRDPRCGRNFEYYSEDPLLAGKMAGAFIGGVQSTGEGACIKHFAANSNEDWRFMGDSQVDERALREIYLRAFEYAIRNYKPYAAMCAYNKLNGIYCSENHRLLTEILRDEWGFGGLVMSDWGAVADRIKAVLAGLDLEMPGDTDYFRRSIIDSVGDGSLPLSEVDKCAGRLLNLINRCSQQKTGKDVDFSAHHALASRIAADCAVLLKNDGTLPLHKDKKYYVSGPMFEKMRYQGAGSSMINPTMLTSPRQSFDGRNIKYTQDESQLDQCDGIIYFGGLTDAESEGEDRADISFPDSQVQEINRLCKFGKPVSVMIFGGSPMEVPFADNVNAILYMNLPGQNGGDATAALIFGEKNPAGRLSETWPLRNADIPFGDQFSKSEVSPYFESVYVGYRYYCTAGVPVRYPFGYGLSYTTFDWLEMTVLQDGDTVTVGCGVTNSGTTEGAEVVQLYVKKPHVSVFGPARELLGFQKLYLSPGETKRAEISFDIKDLAYYNAAAKTWAVENGDYTLMLCANPNDTRFESGLSVSGMAESPAPYSKEINDAYCDPANLKADKNLFSALMGRPLPDPAPVLPITMESRLPGMKATVPGRLLYETMTAQARKMIREAKKETDPAVRENKLKSARFMLRMFETGSMRSKCVSSGGLFPYNKAQAYVEKANGHVLKSQKFEHAPYEVPKLPKDQ